MNAVVLDGRLDESGHVLLDRLLALLGQAGYTTRPFALRQSSIAPCVGCFGCWIKTPGECVIGDVGRDVARAVAQADLVVYFTPVTFGGVSSELKKALDRLIPNISPFFARVRGETHHQRRHARSPSLLGVGVQPNTDREAEAIFRGLVEDNATNLRSPRFASTVVASDRPAGLDEALRAAIRAVAP